MTKIQIQVKSNCKWIVPMSSEDKWVNGCFSHMLGTHPARWPARLFNEKNKTSMPELPNLCVYMAGVGACVVISLHSGWCTDSRQPLDSKTPEGRTSLICVHIPSADVQEMWWWMNGSLRKGWTTSWHVSWTECLRPPKIHMLQSDPPVWWY